MGQDKFLNWAGNLMGSGQIAQVGSADTLLRGACRLRLPSPPPRGRRWTGSGMRACWQPWKCGGCGVSSPGSPPAQPAPPTLAAGPPSRPVALMVVSPPRLGKPLPIVILPSPQAASLSILCSAGGVAGGDSPTCYARRRPQGRFPLWSGCWLRLPELLGLPHGPKPSRATASAGCSSRCRRGEDLAWLITSGNEITGTGINLFPKTDHSSFIRQTISVWGSILEDQWRAHW